MHPIHFPPDYDDIATMLNVKNLDENADPLIPLSSSRENTVMVANVESFLAICYSHRLIHLMAGGAVAVAQGFSSLKEFSQKCPEMIEYNFKESKVVEFGLKITFQCNLLTPAFQLFTLSNTEAPIH